MYLIIMWLSVMMRPWYGNAFCITKGQRSRPFMISLLLAWTSSLKRKCLHFQEIFIPGCTGSCHFWRNFYPWLHWKLSKWQLPLQPVMKISSKWPHYHFSVVMQTINSDKWVVSQPLIYVTNAGNIIGPGHFTRSASLGSYNFLKH